MQRPVAAVLGVCRVVVGRGTAQCYLAPTRTRAVPSRDPRRHDEVAMTKPVTIKDVAAAAGVSTATVSRVLTGDTAISATRRAEVLSTARRMHYRPSAAARRLRTNS